MYLTLPERIPFRQAASAIAVLAVVLLVEGTSVQMTLESMAYLLLGVHATNRAGGLVYPSGAYIFFTFTLTCGVAIVVKAIMGEPLNSHLRNGDFSMLVYLVGMVTLFIASEVNIRFRRKRGWLEGSMLRVDPTQAGLGCVLIVLFLPLVLPAAVIGTFVQFNNAFALLAVMIPVFYVTRASGGRKTFHPVAFFSTVYVTWLGLITFSKQGMLQPSAAWAMAAIAAGVYVSKRKLIILLVCGGVFSFYAGPYSQVGRNYRGDVNLNDDVVYLLTHLEETRARYEESERYAQQFGYHWFDRPMGLVDRLTIMPIDDALIYYTDHGRPGDMTPFYSYLTNMLPRYLWKDKPILRWGNHYAHQIGMLADNDQITGVSFGATAEAYHNAGWLGVTLIAGLFYVSMFLVVDSVSGDVRVSFWGLMYTLYFTHFAAEGSISALPYTIAVFTPSVLGAMIIGTRVAPIVGAAFSVARPQPVPLSREPVAQVRVAAVASQT